MTANGFNPMRWNCDDNGCFNKKGRPKIEVFADCFPRKINFGDVDGKVEYCGAFCLLEWKSVGAPIPQGQQISYINFTTQIQPTNSKQRNAVFIVYGDAETMEVNGYDLVWQGKVMPHTMATLEGLKERIKKWASCAETLK